MNITINYEGHNVTNYVIRYDTQQQICSGVGSITVVVANTFPYTAEPWDQIILREDGDKKGTYSIATISENIKDGTITLTAQDDSKKLADTFITDVYTPTTTTYARYWISLFLDAAGVNYTFNTAEYGAPIAKDTTIGMGSAYDIIIGFLQQSGWYLYFDPNNTAIIGKLSLDSGSYSDTLHSNEILSLDVDADDSMLRNRAVVWGKGSTDGWIFADISRQTTWNYDINDKRAVVLANSNIESFGQASSLANTMLDEFTKKTVTVKISLSSSYDLYLGDIVFVNTSYFKGAGMITSITRSASTEGLITTITLNERCPRLFGFFSYDQGYVYIGTHGSGVWRKQLSDSNWVPFNTGLDTYDIFDLYVANGILACVTYDGRAWTADTDTNTWTEISYPTFHDENNSVIAPVYAQACTINHGTNTVYFLFDYNTTTYSRCWVVLVNGTEATSTELISIGSVYNFTGYDLDTDDFTIYATVGNLSNIGSFVQSVEPIDIFTTYDEYLNFTTGYTPPRSFSFFDLDWTSNSNLEYDILWEVGKATTIQASTITSGNFRFATVDFSGDTPIFTNSKTFSTSSDGLDYDNTFSLAMYSESSTTILIRQDTDVYRYDRTSDTLTFVRSISTVYSREFKNILYSFNGPAYQSPGKYSGSFTLNFNWIDWATGTSGTNEITTKSAYDYTTGVFGQGMGAFDTIIVAIGWAGWLDNSPLADTVVDITIGCARFNINTHTFSSHDELVFSSGSIINDQLNFIMGGTQYSNPSLSIWYQATLDGIEKMAVLNFSTWTSSDGLIYMDELNSVSGVNTREIFMSSGQLYFLPHCDLFLSPGVCLIDIYGNPYGITDSGTFGIANNGLGPYKTDYHSPDISYGLFRQYNSTYPAGYEWRMVALDIPTATTIGSSYVILSERFGPLEFYFQVSQNVIGGKYTSYTTSRTYYLFFQFGDLENFSVGNYYTIRRFTEEYKIIDKTTTNHKVEISRQDGPLVTFADDDVADSLRVGFPPTSGYVFPSGGANDVPTPTDYPIVFNSPNPPVGPVYDARIFNTTTSGVIGSGAFVGSGASLIVALQDGFKVAGASLGGWTVVMSGPANKCETSNETGNPYMFITLSGIPISGYATSGIFYQKNNVAGANFIDYSVNLPSSLITVIRLDDRI